MLPPNLGEIEALLGILADRTRLGVLNALVDGELTAGEIEQAIGKSQSTTSQQLKKMVDADVLGVRKVGTKKFYRVKDSQVFDMLHVVNSYISAKSIRDVREGLSQGERAKVLLMGLDNSGKTSIIMSLTGENLISYLSLKPMEPTIALDQVHDGVITYWDAPGQLVYREEFFENPRKSVIGTDRLVYVIDVQDRPRYGESLEFFQKVLAKFVELDVHSELTVFLHKFDPHLEADGNYTDEVINDRLLNKLKSLIPAQLNYQVFKTTIFTVFRKTLVMRMIAP